ncbi:hypothetical protein FRC01_002447 [Tulasnella sp. 417]|nr:hypothetical protein FRC01_002447 [Tulasnella sp. 417]
MLYITCSQCASSSLEPNSPSTRTDHHKDSFPLLQWDKGPLNIQIESSLGLPVQISTPTSDGNPSNFQGALAIHLLSSKTPSFAATSRSLNPPAQCELLFLGASRYPSSTPLSTPKADSSTHNEVEPLPPLHQQLPTTSRDLPISPLHVHSSTVTPCRPQSLSRKHPSRRPRTNRKPNPALICYTITFACRNGRVVFGFGRVEWTPSNVQRIARFVPAPRHLVLAPTSAHRSRHKPHPTSHPTITRSRIPPERSTRSQRHSRARLGVRAPRGGGGQSSKDGLKPLKEGLENVVSKVVGPFVSVIKTEVSAVIAELEKEPPSSPAVLGGTPATAAPLCSADQRFDKTLARVASLLSRVTFAGEASQSTHVQSMLATFEIGVMWGSLVAWSNRPLPRCSSADELASPPREPSPDLGLRRTMSEARLRTQPSDSSLSTSSDESAKTDYAAQEKRQQHLPSPPPTHRRWLLGRPLPPSPAQRPLSPADHPTFHQEAVHLQASFFKTPFICPCAFASHGQSRSSDSIFASEASSSWSGGLDPFAAAYKPFILALTVIARNAKSVQMSVKRLVLPVEGGLARDAVDEALKELAGFVAFADYLAAPDTGSSVLLLGTSKDGVDMEKLMKKTTEAPMPLVLPVLLRVALLSAKFDPPSNTAPTSPAPKVPDTVSAWIGLPEDEYRRSCLGGFGKADECAAIVGKVVLKNKRMGVLFWMREWLERSVREEEEDSSSDEQEDDRIQA